MAEKALTAVVPSDNGARSAIPPKAFAELRKELLLLKHERTAFEHLCVLWARLKKDGLKLAAQQMLELAKIGLKPAELEAATARAETLRGAAEMLSGGPRTAGAGVMKPKFEGVSMRPKPALGKPKRPGS